MSKISENPSAKALLEQLQVVEDLNAIINALPFVASSFPNTVAHFAKLPELKQQAEILLLPDQFNSTFAQQGWIAYESMSLDAMRSAMQIERENGLVAAEHFLANYYDEETLSLGVRCCSGHVEFRKRERLISLAREDYLAGRYHACVPLLLSLIDGLVNDISRHVGFFADGANMTAWDSIAAHETGLKALAKIMGLGRNKTNEEQISIPYRNGILHGRELAFDNKVVAAKCWAALFAIRDWAASLAEGKGQPKFKKESTLDELFQGIAANEQTKKVLAAWRPRPVASLGHLPYEGESTALPEDSPERVLAEFLENWCNERYGPMADALVDYSDTSKGKKAGEAKKDFGCQIPIKYRIVGISKEEPAMCRVEVDLVLQREHAVEPIRLSIVLIHSDSANNQVIWGYGTGAWKIIQNGFGKVIYGS